MTLKELGFLPRPEGPPNPCAVAFRLIIKVSGQASLILIYFGHFSRSIC